MSNQLLRVICFCMATIIFACKKPTDGLELTVSNNVFGYRINIGLSDAKDSLLIPPDAKATISGRDGNYIYDNNGKKEFKINNGLLELGVLASKKPTPNNPLIFDVEISAPGYLPFQQTLTITEEGLSYQRNISLINILQPPSHLKLFAKQISLVNGATAQQEVSQVNRTNVDYSDGSLTTVVLPQGTRFYYYKTIVTGYIKSTISEPIYQTVSHPLSSEIYYKRLVGYYQKEIPITEVVTEYIQGNNIVKLIPVYTTGTDKSSVVFPYNYMAANSIKVLGGSNVPEDKVLFKSAVKRKLVGVYFTAEVNGQPVSVSPDKASQWFTSFQLDPAIINPYTNQPIKAGDSLETGIDINNRTTRAAIKSVSGQLRLESQTTDAGFYYEAPYSINYSYTFDTKLLEDVPDIENLNAGVTVSLGAAGYFWQPVSPSGMNSNSSITYSGKINSNTPISPLASASINYWGKKINMPNIPSGSTTSIYGTIGTILYPKVTFDLSLKCPAKQSAIKLTMAGRVQNGGTSGNAGGFLNPNNGRLVPSPFFNVVSGLWGTRGLPINPSVEYTLAGFINGEAVSMKQAITGSYIPIDKQGTEAQCKLIPN